MLARALREVSLDCWRGRAQGRSCRRLHGARELLEQRTVRRHSQGAVVAVQVKDRPWLAVLGDMIEGVVVANRLTPPQADRVRDQLWVAMGVEPAARVA